MDGFKKIIKMKTGGSVSKAVAASEEKKMRAGAHSDIKEDKKIVKKAFNMHDDQQHEGRTDLSGLKKGGRCKKSGGSLRKFAAGGLTEELAKGKKRPRPSEPPGGVEPDDVPYSGYKKGGKIKKMADGGLSDMMAASQAAGSSNTMPQNAMTAEMLKRKKMAQMAGAAPSAPVGQPTPQNIGATTGPIMKKGGKVKKDCK